MNTNDMCCVTLDRPAAKELFYIPQPTFIIPIFRAPTTTSTLKSITKTSTSKIITAILKHEQREEENTSNMISQRIFENLILTNTVVAVFCIVLMITLTGFLIFLLIPSIRRRWLNEKQKEEGKIEDLSTISRQQSFQQFSLGPSRLNPLFEPTAGTTTTTTQFGQLFQIHPTIWTPMTPAPVVSSPIPIRQAQISAPATTSTTTKSATATTTTAAATNVAGRPPLPTHPPTTTQRSPRRRQQN
jgi:hypothetical protein